MKKLDCYNKETVIDSLCSIFEIERNVLLSTIKTLKYNTKEEMYAEFISLLEYSQEPQYDVTYYYHVTRVFDIRDFDRGILPLTSSENIINIHLEKIEEEATSTFFAVHDLFNNYNPGTYCLLEHRKRTSEVGICMSLNLDLAISGENNDHKYHLAPECVEDKICMMDNTIKPRVWELYYKKTNAYYFKIEMERRNLPDLQHALFYLYYIIMNEDRNIDNNSIVFNDGLIPLSLIVEKDIINFDVYKYIEEKNAKTEDEEEFNFVINVIKPS